MEILDAYMVDLPDGGAYVKNPKDPDQYRQELKGGALGKRYLDLFANDYDPLAR